VGIRVGFCKYNITIEKCTLEKVEKDFLMPLYSFTDEGVIGKVLVSCINTMRVRIVICCAFRFLFVTPVRLLESSVQLQCEVLKSCLRIPYLGA
jgi:hypothetical protein